VREPLAAQRHRSPSVGARDRELPGERGLVRARRAGLRVILDMHNYGAYYLSDGTQGVRRPIGSDQVRVPHFVDVWRRLDVSFDDFIRTTEPRHRTSVQTLVRRMTEAGDIYEGEYEGWYCVGCEQFKREGEIVEGRCVLHPGRELEWSTQRNWFFRLSRYEPMLRELIYRLHLYNHVFLMGRTPTLDDELAKSSLFVLSSRFEGMPMVMIEAMTHALPVVSFDCPTGPRDVLTDGVDGLLVPPQNIDALSQAMQKLMGDASLRRQLGEAARKTAKAYGPEAIGAQWEALLKDLSASH
jgi:hypothetical protein